jgi:LmbE family N-acetylglucosaminyl deacetylase
VIRSAVKWGLGAGLAAVVIVGGLALRELTRLFEEPSAEPVSSLVGTLGAKRVLGVFAHPDDEQLVTGLLVRAKQRDGAFTALLAATRGEAGRQSPVVARQSELGEIRKAELLKNGFALGVDTQEVWEYPDGDVPSVPIEELTSRIEAAITRYEPDLVVTFWPESGATGHPDHRRVGLAAQTAVERLVQQGAGPRWLVYALTPREALARMGGERGAELAAASPDPTHVMPGEVAYKLRGWEIHASQRDFIQETYGVPARVLYWLWDHEFYRVVEIGG